MLSTYPLVVLFVVAVPNMDLTGCMATVLALCTCKLHAIATQLHAHSYCIDSLHVLVSHVSCMYFMQVK